MRYDADTAPDPEAWLALEEQERLDLAVKYHRKNRLPMGQNPKMHGVAHVIVENQVASGDATAVPATLTRLMREGLDRHDAIHAIASVLMGMVFEMTKAKVDFDKARYGRELGELTAASWRAQAE